MEQESEILHQDRQQWMMLHQYYIDTVFVAQLRLCA